MPTSVLGEFLCAARAVANLPDLELAFDTAARRWGFDQWVVARSEGLRRSTLLAASQQAGVWLSSPGDQYFLTAPPVVAVLANASRPLWWSQTVGLVKAEDRADVERALANASPRGLSVPVWFDHSSWICDFAGASRDFEDITTDCVQLACIRFILFAAQLRLESSEKYSDSLTSAQIRIVALLANGSTIKDAARKLGLSPSTVYNQIASAKQRVGMRTVCELTRYATERGMV